MIFEDLVGRKSQSQGLSPTNILFIPLRPRDAPEHAATTTTQWKKTA